MEDPLLALLFRLNENQIALSLAIDELTAWVTERGSVQVGEAVEQHLQTLQLNADAIEDALAQLIAERALRPRS
ncbi:hypothetical protein [Pseudomonas oryzihabitans]|uniref:hypothetical protein n=1 Tax=Pseudomonas oryzihabitans TaxID=47885 RepID=UPI0011A7780E|nr:hypothetical protein [Pseudomonas psychrotolerans]